MAIKLRRLSVTAAVTSLVAASLAGILGGWLANRWTWGIATVVLLLIAIGAGAEAVKALGENSDTERKDKAATDGNRIISIASGAQTVVNDSIVAAGDVHKSTTNIKKDSWWPIAAIICLSALAAATGGTIHFSISRGGEFYSGTAGARVTARQTSGPTSPSMPTGIFATSGPGITYDKAVTFTESDSTDDSATQSIYIGRTPRIAATIASLANEIQNSTNSCGDDGQDTPSRDLAIPFYIVSTLTSKISAQVSLEMEVSQFFDNSSNVNGLKEVVYVNSANGIDCDMLATPLTQEGVPS